MQPLKPTAKRLSDQIAAHLRDRICRGQYEPGDRLIEADLSIEMGVSRAPLREALVALKRDGLVELVPYRGAVVTSFNDDDLHEITDLRRALEAVAARRAAELAPAETAKALRRQLRRMSEAATEGDTVAAALAHIDFHRAIGEASGYGRLVDFLDQLAAQSLALQSYAMLAAEDLMALAVAHEGIVEAIASGDPDRAEQRIVAHVVQTSAPVRAFLRGRNLPDGE
jgi:DNA-binding GntR family transcriptional regulator